ncbi:hypothetical protein [Dyella nitratireducens]|uniref:HTH araC/xylS-type domain-containing protein n=1 Tax=Dyella nitratireducens TaxID=1849580 RepID=A0ABQ1GHT4_9GAMM|nr:hypothetical protein [Dyella nitratireducens]GGA44138.1 hypothetical protein GCM10010981_36610 [Dyella nitratireducens]GLQ41782.1 hypothetical protein GCM10007902_16320 [Dyella nitratireducens]
MHIKLGTAGLSDELALRLSLACGLLAASQIHVDIQDWRGNESDILIVDIDSGHGRLAYEVAARRNLPVMVFPRSGDSETSYPSKLDRDAPAAAIARALQEKLQPSSEPTSDDVQGLLGICIREAGCHQDLLVKRGSIALILRHAAGRIITRSVSDVPAAETRLLENAWLCVVRPANDPYANEWLVSRSLESFLINACARHRASLPSLGGKLYRLTRWPDLGSVTENEEALRLSALLQRSAWSADALAQHTGIAAHHINAFFWATLASGALACADGSTVTFAAPPAAASTASSLIQRVARHFGLKLGYSHA